MNTVNLESSRQWSYVSQQYVVRGPDSALIGRYNTRRIAEYVARRNAMQTNGLRK